MRASKSPARPVLVVGVAMLTGMVAMNLDVRSPPPGPEKGAVEMRRGEDLRRRAQLVSTAPPGAQNAFHHHSVAGKSHWFDEAHRGIRMPVGAVSFHSLPSSSEWRAKRGYGLDDYDSYDEETLRQMAATGDAIAQYVLGRRRMSDDPAESLALNFDATIGGFTSSITTTAIVHRLIAEGRLSAPTAPRWRPGATREEGMVDTNPTTNLISAYAWGLVAQMRGDPTGMNLNKDLEQNLALLDGDQLESACALANQTYRELEQRRASAGFRPFDNTPPVISIVDLSQAGERCDNWPVPRPSCARRYATMGSRVITVYECSAG